MNKNIDTVDFDDLYSKEFAMHEMYKSIKFILKKIWDIIPI